ncbi:MAG TPA: thioredoxin, partial [Solirubrobacteraceae bacterium]|nr:thioredoxin [Solirubrobacteraceae bacterium]
AKGVPRCGSCHQSLPWLVEASASSFQQEVTSSVPVVVDLWAPWCGPCRMMAPALEQLARRRAGHLKVVKLNVDEHPAIAARFGVQGIPLLVLLRDGREVARQAGAAPLPQLERWLDGELARAG